MVASDRIDRSDETGTTGRVRRNRHIEAFHSILEEDCISLHEFKTFAEAYQTITEFMSFYNEVRLHSSIGYKPTQDYHDEVIRNIDNVLAISA